MKFSLQKFNPAEMRLLAAFGIVVVFLVHLFGLRALFHQAGRLGAEVELRRAEQQMVTSLLSESAFWEPRGQWLAQHLPPKTADTKRVLDGKMEGVAKQFSLVSPRGQTTEESGDFYDSEHYNTSLSGKWSALVQALQKFYLPGEGIAVTALEIKAVDEKTHVAAITLSRFFLREKP